MLTARTWGKRASISRRLGCGNSPACRGGPSWGDSGGFFARIRRAPGQDCAEQRGFRSPGPRCFIVPWPYRSGSRHRAGPALALDRRMNLQSGPLSHASANRDLKCAPGSRRRQGPHRGRPTGRRTEPGPVRRTVSGSESASKATAALLASPLQNAATPGLAGPDKPVSGRNARPKPFRRSVWIKPAAAGMRGIRIGSAMSRVGRSTLGGASEATQGLAG
jgi:hypothetical protein